MRRIDVRARNIVSAAGSGTVFLIEIFEPILLALMYWNDDIFIAHIFFSPRERLYRRHSLRARFLE